MVVTVVQWFILDLSDIMQQVHGVVVNLNEMSFVSAECLTILLDGGQMTGH